MALSKDFIVRRGIVVAANTTIPSSNNLITTSVVRSPATPALDLNFTRATSLDSRIQFTRATGATVVGATGLIKYVGNDVPRFDYSPTTGQLLGLLIEEQRTNIYSNSAQASLWTNNGNSVITPSAITAPDGSMADIVTNTPSANSYVRPIQAAISTATNYTRSIYAKGLGGNNLLIMETTVNSTQYTTRFDVSTGSVVSSTTGTSSITNAGNGWWRCVLTVQSLTTADLMSTYYIGGYGSTPLTVPIALWGAQLEVGAQPSSYIPTTSASATRAADRCLLSAGSWYTPNQGTWYAEYQGRRESTQGFYGRVLSPSNSYTILGTDGGATTNVGTWGGGTSLVLATGADYWTTIGKGALAYDNTALTRSLSGRGLITTGTYTVSDAQNYVITSSMGIGQNSQAASNMLNGRIRKITYWPTRLTNAQLQQLTS